MNRIRIANRTLIVVVVLALALILGFYWRWLKHRSDGGILSEVPAEPDERWSAVIGDVQEGHYIRVYFSHVESTGIESVFFHDITGDGVPEVWLLTEGSEADRMVLVYSISDWSRELLRGPAGHSGFYAGKGYVLRREAHMGYSSWLQLSWNGERVVSKKVFEEFTDGDYAEPAEKRLQETRPEDLSPNELLKRTR